MSWSSEKPMPDRVRLDQNDIVIQGPYELSHAI